MSSDRQRSLLIAKIWALRIGATKHPGAIPKYKNIHFINMLKHESYRGEVLNAAAESSEPEIKSVALEALKLNMSGALIRANNATEVILGAREYGNRESDKTQQLAHTEERETQQPPLPQESGGKSSNWNHARLGLAVFIGLTVITTSVYSLLTTSPWEISNRISISGSISQPATWTADKTYHLEGLVFVESGTTLRIEPGTRVEGSFGSALIVTRDAKINAQGTREAPIVFTSSKPAGKRERGDWGGLVLLGNAPVNTGTGNIEGIDKHDPRGSFGGSDEYDSCGVLKFVRIEFAGYEISTDNELNGLTLGGCGQGTLISYIQVHRGLDDGIEFFGGSAGLRYAVISQSGDDGLDWDRGWRGKGQFIIVQQSSDKGDNAIEADNYKSNPDALPRSAPTLFNISLIGSGDSNIAQRGLLLRRGTGGMIANALVTGFTKEALDIRDPQTVKLSESGNLRIVSSVLSKESRAVEFFPGESGDADDDNGFSEAEWINSPGLSNRLLERGVMRAGLFQYQSPDFIPPKNSVAAQVFSPIPEGEFWDAAANYAGALRPGARSSWLDGWTAFPIN
jgi:hypothetical protein